VKQDEANIVREFSMSSGENRLLTIFSRPRHLSGSKKRGFLPPASARRYARAH
jgi:hypothetical protein